MPYTTLEKIYYKNRAEYEKEYAARLASPSCVKFDFTIHGHNAFFIVTPKILDMTNKILVKNTDAFMIDLPALALAQFMMKSLIDEIYQSLDIEHVHSTRREISELLDNVGKKKQKRLSGMVDKYFMLINNEDIPLSTCIEIRKLYDDLCLSEVIEEDPTNKPDGKIFRRKEVFIEKKSRRIHSGSFPEHVIITEMDRALLILHDESIALLIRVAVFHYLFAYIHPFYDGNGRMARFITSYMLSKKLGILISVRISYTIKENINLYYRMFKETNERKNRGDLTEFIECFLLILDESMDNLTRALKERRQKLTYFNDLLGKVLKDKQEFNFAYLILQFELFGISGATRKQINKMMSLGDYKINKLLQEANIAKLIKTTKSGNKYTYSFNLDELEKMASNETGIE